MITILLPFNPPLLHVSNIGLKIKFIALFIQQIDKCIEFSSFSYLSILDLGTVSYCCRATLLFSCFSGGWLAFQLLTNTDVELEPVEIVKSKPMVSHHLNAEK